jgi:site-specific recombinase XerD
MIEADKRKAIYYLHQEGMGMILILNMMELVLSNFFRTKNKRERIENLMPRTKKALLEWKSHFEFMRHRNRIQSIETRFVFCRLNGEPIKRFDSAGRRICKIAKINDFHYHDLRHTFCSNLLLSGANIKDLKEMIGHSNISMTDRYSHLTLNHHKGMQEKLAKHYENSTTGSKIK